MFRAEAFKEKQTERARRVPTAKNRHKAPYKQVINPGFRSQNRATCLHF